MKKVNFLLPNFGKKPIGGFKIVYVYANYLCSKGYHVNIIYGHRTHEDQIVDYVKDKIRIKINKPTWYQLRPGIKEYRCYKLNERNVPDADVTVATAWNTAIVLEQLSERKGKKVYLIQHYEIWSGPQKDVDETWRYDMKKIVISKWLYEIGTKLNAQDMVYIPNSINFKKYKLKQPVQTRKNIVAMLYSEQKWKGSQIGIEALKKVRKEIPDLQVFLFGTCERKRNIPSWMDYYENPKQDVIVNDIYNNAAVFLCASQFEGWGLPPMEAMACGCAVVSTRNGGVEDFAIDEQTALLCDVNNSDQMALQMIRLLRNQELRMSISGAGTKYVRRFKWKDSFETFEKVINEEEI